MVGFDFTINNQDRYKSVINYLDNCEGLTKSKKEDYVITYNSGDESLTLDERGLIEIEVHATENFSKIILRGLIKRLSGEAN